MGKLYNYRTEDQVVLELDASPSRGACAGAVCLWLQQRVQGQPLMTPPDLAEATALQQTLTNLAPALYDQRNASVYIAYKLHAVGLQTGEEIGTKDFIDLFSYVCHRPGLYYLSLSVSSGGLHAVGLQVLENDRYYLFDPDDGLSELSFAELVEHFLLECEDEDQFAAVKVLA
ncbi:hypothetical protein [Endozoicomonas lisbonensis]|uniref:Peptidase C58 YopT-type domain-containing protein n=1 Tax=Endozoicomonas lisbonensis TaxID=3120522 RepID=A0ABV2SP06_9GAMM